MSFIYYNKAEVAQVLPEKRASMVFTQPDVFMHFGEIKTLYIYDYTIEKLDESWKNKLTKWWGKLDFNSPEEAYTYNRVSSEYRYIDFAILPELASLTEEEQLITPLVWNNNELMINTHFITALQQAEAVDIWFDRLH